MRIFCQLSLDGQNGTLFVHYEDCVVVFDNSAKGLLCEIEV